jgi:hypothetical protein
MGSKRDKHIPAGKIRPDLPRKAVPPAAGRAAAILVPPAGRLIVRWTRFDYDGPFCLARSDVTTIVSMMKRVREIETMAPLEVFKPNGIGVDYGEPGGLPNTIAINRIKYLNLQDETNISRLRISGRERLYGFRRDREFYAIFWDPKHEIWPSELKHT